MTRPEAGRGQSSCARGWPRRRPVSEYCVVGFPGMPCQDPGRLSAGWSFTRLARLAVGARPYRAAARPGREWV